MNARVGRNVSITNSEVSRPERRKHLGIHYSVFLPTQHCHTARHQWCYRNASGRASKKLTGRRKDTTSDPGSWWSWRTQPSRTGPSYRGHPGYKVWPSSWEFGVCDLDFRWGTSTDKGRSVRAGQIDDQEKDVAAVLALVVLPRLHVVATQNKLAE